MRKCSASGMKPDGTPWKCDREHHAKGLCKTHFEKRRRGQALTRIGERREQRKVLRYNGKQRCTDCLKIKPLSEFYDSQSYCKSCKSDRERDRKFARGASKWLYKKLAEQNGECALCGTDDPGERNWQLHHDHDYSKSDPDGWQCVLCARCNMAEGYVNKGWNYREFAKRMATMLGNA